MFVNSEVVDIDIWEFYGFWYSFVVIVLDVYVGDRFSLIILEFFDSRGFEVVSILGNKFVGIVDVLKVFGYGLCVGVVSVEEEFDFDIILKGFGGVLCFISICCCNIVVVNIFDIVLMGV